MTNRNTIFATILSALTCFGFLPQIQAQLPPEIPGNPDGCYPNFTTAEGCNALHQLFGGLGNTAVGWYANFLAGDASFNTSVGAGALALDSGIGASTNTAVGTAAMILNLSGSGNTAVGTNALVFNSVASDNTAVGSFALYNNDSTGNGAGTLNTAVGGLALLHNTDGGSNTAVGRDALEQNQTGNVNTAVGFAALTQNTAGGNTAVGASALSNNDTGSGNNAFGYQALELNVDGDGNLAMGHAALFSNVSALGNIAIGNQALFKNDSDAAGTAAFNTAIGASALFNNVDGDSNTAVGFEAGEGITGVQNVAVGLLDTSINPGITSGNNNVVVGTNAGAGITIGSFNTIVGDAAGTSINTFNNNIYIGQSVNPPGPLAESDTIRIADSSPSVGGPATSQVFFGGIFGANVGAAGSPVQISTNGQLGTLVSSARFKKDIDPMRKSSEAIFSLRPVTFHYKGDETNLPQFGLIAEDVAKVNPALIIMDKEGKPLTVRYEQINAMLLNEFLKEHRKVEEQQASIAELKNEVQTVVAQLKEQAAQIQKVSAQLEVSKPASQTVLNNQ